MDDIFGNKYISELHFVHFLRECREGNVSAATHQLKTALLFDPDLSHRIEELLTHWASKDHQGYFVDTAQKGFSVIEKVISESAYSKKRVLAKLYLAQAFNGAQQGRNGYTLLNLFQGILRNPMVIFNRGVLSIFFKAFIPVSFLIPMKTASSAGIEQIPEGVLQEIKGKLGKQVTNISPLALSTSPFEKSFQMVVGDNEVIFRKLVRHTSSDLRFRLFLMDLLNDHSILVPKIILSGYCKSQQNNPFFWLLEEKLAGSWFELGNINGVDRIKLLKQLGENIMGLHQIPVLGFGRIVDSGLTGESSTFSEWLESKKFRFLSGVFTGAISEFLIEKVLSACDYLEEHYIAPPVLCHGDLQPGNIIVNQGNVQGLIDWEQVMAGDPAYDFASLFIGCLEWFPEFNSNLLSEIMAGYMEAQDDLFAKRIKAHMVLILAELLIWAFDEEQKKVDMVKNGVLEIKAMLAKFIQVAMNFDFSI